MVGFACEPAKEFMLGQTGSPLRTSYTLDLNCGCIVSVSVHPESRIARTRILQTRGRLCTNKRHEVGSRLYLWELLPDPIDESKIEWTHLRPSPWIA